VSGNASRLSRANPNPYDEEGLCSIMHEFADQVRALADGPHSPEQTVEVARVVEEAVRVLAYATRGNAGIRYASTLYDVAGALHAAVCGLDQVFRQADEWVTRHEHELTFDTGSPAGIDDALVRIGDARGAAFTLARALDHMQGALAPIGGPLPTTEEATR